MSRSFTLAVHPALWLGSPVALVLAAGLSTYDGGVTPGSGGTPAGTSRMLPSCANCHSGSQPQAGRSNGPTVSLTATKHALQPGETIQVTTGATGGLSGSDGGFAAEATTGSFTATSSTRVVNGGAAITHRNGDHRSWTFGFTAPNTVGPVELTSVVMTSNGGGSSGDEFAFSGYDGNATVGTPTRLYVLPAGVTNVGTGCPDGYGNYSVLGANGVPAIGNAGFAFDLIGAAPSSFAFLLTGFNPPGFTGIDLGALYGLTGCTGYVATPTNQGRLTGAGVTERGEGSATFPLPVPNMPNLIGVTLDVQGAYIDPSARALLGRSSPVSFSNGLRLVVQ